MKRFLAPFLTFGIIMIIGFLLIVFEKNDALLQFIGILLLFGGVFAAAPLDLKEK